MGQTTEHLLRLFVLDSSGTPCIELPSKTFAEIPQPGARLPLSATDQSLSDDIVYVVEVVRSDSLFLTLP
jgi:hypothetical protein